MHRSLVANAQKKCSFRLLRSSQEIKKSSDKGLLIKNIRRAYRTDSILIKTTDKKMISLPNESVWGIRPKTIQSFGILRMSFIK
jgi:predicted ATP-grasp superfamily ATP-dependent carboligase